MNTKLKVILLTFLLCVNLLNAQNMLPKLNSSGRTAESFVPVDWKIISKSEGDLNNDKLEDLAFVIGKSEEILMEGDSVPSLFNHRILGVFLKQKDNGYTKIQQSNTFILTKDKYMQEPFQGILITNQGALEINFQIWKDETKWFVTNHSYKFLFQNNLFNLVSYNLNETNRENGNSIDYSIDFVSKKMTIYSYNYLNNIVPTTENIKFKLDFLINLETLKMPFQWEFQGLMI